MTHLEKVTLVFNTTILIPRSILTYLKVQHKFLIKYFSIKKLMNIYLKMEPTFLIKLFNDKEMSIYTYLERDTKFLTNILKGHLDKYVLYLSSTFMHFFIFFKQFKNYLLFQLNRRIHYIKWDPIYFCLTIWYCKHIFLLNVFFYEWVPEGGFYKPKHVAYTIVINSVK